MTDREAVAAMGERLICLRLDVLAFLMSRYEFSLANAEDVYSETCEYMLRRGYQLLDMDNNFDAAIRTTAARRALNALRRNRYESPVDVVGILSHQERLEDGYDHVEAWDSFIDGDVFTNHLRATADTPSRRIIAEHFTRGEVITELARKNGINVNTMAGALRWARIKVRELCQART